MKKSDFIEKQWRISVRFLKIFPFFILLIVAINILQDARAGQPFDWMHLAYGAGFIVFTGVMYIFMRMIFDFVRAISDYHERSR
ncbi:hypothetical protein [Sphingopyxis sp. FD7]|jgi:hypothetical protein|uniref:hypothetical protein n=1 Tax=Sphingopyxis sp. FD7 TaxID=1914525 RepID=UPI000DC612CA|nr:hypothetical protein [Sphingopyxis sp. FD7]BBB12295.1 hypothetical protein SPYCA_1553 [Sphingopyxis sp. FD7]